MPISLNNYLPDYKSYSVERLFSLSITQERTSTKILMQLLNNQVSTSGIPAVVEMLKLHLPNVLLTKCYNEENLPFIIEVQNTEIGHLFEHILLEYLCQLKIAKGFSRASFAGRTRWNWVRDPRGQFHIRLNCGVKDADILPEGIEKTIALMKILMQNNQQALLPIRNTHLSRNGLKNGERSRRK
jgi:hypothetical protein